MSQVSAHALTQNCASHKISWALRLVVLQARIWLRDPDFLLFTELYAGRRGALTRRISARYHLAGYYYGKAIYVRRGGRWQVSSGLQKMTLGHGKHALGVRVTHQATGATLVLVVVHTSWQKGRDRYREIETRKVIALTERHFGRVPTIYGGDWNSSIHKGSRKRDAVGEVMAAHKIPEAYRKALKHTHEEYNSANQYKRPAPKHRIHLDRFFGIGVSFKSWYLDYYSGRYGADHFGVGIKFTVNY